MQPRELQPETNVFFGSSAASSRENGGCLVSYLGEPNTGMIRYHDDGIMFIQVAETPTLGLTKAWVMRYVFEDHWYRYDRGRSNTTTTI